MKTLMALALGLALTAALAAQDEGKKKVEQPLKKAVAPGRVDLPKTVVIEEALLEAVKSPPSAKFNLSKTGIPWYKGIDAALNKGKPILLLQILGNYDDVYC